MKTKNIKRTPKNTQPHRYFLLPTTGDDANGNKVCSRIIVFPHGADGGSSYFDDSLKAGLNWWRLDEMNTLKCVEIRAELVKRIAKV